MLLLVDGFFLTGGLSMTQTQSLNPAPAVVIDVTELEPGLFEKVRVANSGIELIYEYGTNQQDKKEVCKIIRVI